MESEKRTNEIVKMYIDVDNGYIELKFGDGTKEHFIHRSKEKTFALEANDFDISVQLNHEIIKMHIDSDGKYIKLKFKDGTTNYYLKSD